MSSALELTAGNFDSTVGAGVTLVDFWAEWCGPCRLMGPVLDDLAKDYGDKAKVRKVNVDNEPDLAMKFEVSSIPTLIVFKDGQISKRFVGVTQKNDLKAAIDSAVG
ncbi:MAG: thioredoxin [Candidatus Hydrogenedentes bacterium]|nr:thioredoxin [Candidatus Hydrogenedentota bacterium]